MVYRRFLKRFFDLLLAIFLSIILLLPLLIIALIVKLTSKGPILFIQERYGRNSRPFKLYKFRSMTDSAPQIANSKFTDIQNYITISFDDLVNVIDEIGGVTVFISEEEAAYYRENGMPDIQAGDVTLTGSQALAHARNRTLGNDFERTRRQRSVMYGIYRKIMEKKDPSALLPLINYAVNHVKTNMSVSEMYSMAKDVLSVDDLKMQQTCIPQDGTYTDITYEGMQVLKVDFDANKKKIEQLLY